jgi:DNA transformation protein
MLVGAGVADVRTLRALGAASAFRRVLFAREGRVSRNLLWALEGALSGRRWNQLDVDTKARLLREVEADDV